MRVEVLLKRSFWNQNPGKSIWGGAIFSATDSFYPIMLKQIIMKQFNIPTEVFTKATNLQYLRESKTDITFEFVLTKSDVTLTHTNLMSTNKHEEWYRVAGHDTNGKICIQADIQAYLRCRNNEKEASK
jgi:hypothetical protein